MFNHISQHDICRAHSSTSPHLNHSQELYVLKFGSSVIPTTEAMNKVVDDIAKRVQSQQKVVAVVSAMGNTTEELLQQAHAISAQPSPEAVAALLHTGEATTMALLSLALSEAGLSHTSFDSREMGLRTQGSLLDGTPCDLDVEAIEKALAHVPVVVIPGFVGHDQDGRPSLLGRGGSDLTALFVAHHLQAQCCLYKDVDGIYDKDPAQTLSSRRFRTIAWDDVLDLEAVVVQDKAIRFAKENSLDFHVTRIGSPTFTTVGDHVSCWADDAPKRSPKKLLQRRRKSSLKPATQLLHTETSLQDPYCASVSPLYQSATFCQDSATVHGQYDYSRSGNPTRTELQEKVAALCEAEKAFAFSSGMAAISTVTRLLQCGDELLAGSDLYGGTFRLFSKVLSRQGITVKFVDLTDLSSVREAISPNTQMVWVETPSNPQQVIVDIPGLAEVCEEEGVLLTVDNTFLSPYWQKPLNLGADIVVHSATKYLCGHSDTSAGIVAVNSPELAEEIGFFQNAEGNALAPFDAWLFLRGLKTLSVRLEQQQKNAKKVASFLDNHPEVSEVYYPGLKSHPGYELHRRQSTGVGAVISLAMGTKERACHIVEATKLFSICVSFGSVSSTISVPSTMSHASIPKEIQEKKGFPTDLVRISVGIEDVDDLLADLQQAFDTLDKPIKPWSQTPQPVLVGLS